MAFSLDNLILQHLSDPARVSAEYDAKHGGGSVAVEEPEPEQEPEQQSAPIPGRVSPHQRKPAWLKMQMPGGAGYNKLMGLVNKQKLHTVCQSAKCPNIGECWSAGTATMMILGDICTRNCGFCNIKTGKPTGLDLEEPYRIGQTVKQMALGHVVITSVDRDDLSDGGAAIWAETIRQIRAQSPGTTVEVLIPDFAGDWNALQLVLDTRPNVLAHNVESAPRLYRTVRPQGKYHRSLKLLQIAKDQGFITKTNIMLGLGENADDIELIMDDLVAISCDILTVGQYLQPTPRHLKVERWVTPEEFKHWKEYGEAKGIHWVESGAMVRSSYHAEKQYAMFAKSVG